MQKAKTAIVVAVAVALFTLYAASPALATQGLSVDPGIIGVGKKTTITLTMEVAATGKLNVTCVLTGNSWYATTDISIPSGGGSQSWVFPDDFGAGANTGTVGSYKANATIEGGTFIGSTFRVEFFVIPDLPFGSIMAVIGCFAAIGGYAELRKYSTKKV